MKKTPLLVSAAMLALVLGVLLFPGDGEGESLMKCKQLTAETLGYICIQGSDGRMTPTPTPAPTYMISTEISFSSEQNGLFVKTATGAALASKVICSLAFVAPTGKVQDEMTMDPISLIAYASGTDQITIHAHARYGPVNGAFSIVCIYK